MEWHQKYQAFHDLFVPAVLAKGISYRLNETSNFSKGGAVGASDTYAAALWAVDYLYWWAHHSAAGLNFHSGQKVLPGSGGPDKPNVYTALTSSEKGISLLPLAYGLKIFDLGGHGKLLPVEVRGNSEQLNLVAYGVEGGGKRITVTLVNREFGQEGRGATVTIDAGKAVSRAETVVLAAESGEMSATKNLNLGGGGFGEDGEWKGKWSPLGKPLQGGKVVVEVAPATAVVVKLTLE